MPCQRQRLFVGAAIIAAMNVLLPSVAVSAPAGLSLDGASLSAAWIIPFVGMLLSIALLPLLAPRLWHVHYGKISAAWALAFLVPASVLIGPSIAARELLHTVLLEYLPFIILLLSLFTVAGGVLVRGNLHGSPLLNTLLLAIGTAIASITGTTGASLLLIRPVIRANDNRLHNIHVVIFFIFLVSNIGGALTPLGDPPLFLGFLKGVSFFWPTIHLIQPVLLCVILLLAVFYVLDWYLFHIDENYPPKPDPTPDSRIRVVGGLNIALLFVILLVVAVSGVWRPNMGLEIFGITLELQNLVRDIVLLAITWVSWRFTPKAFHAEHGFSWGAIIEVAKLFAGIFITIIPAIAILKAGKQGVFAPIVALVTTPDGQPINAMYFWLSGGLSSFLDNAPTYLVFFNLAGGDAATLMGPLAATLAAISAGSVFMGANTYIGNAPNFMVKTIAEEQGIRMPSFFAYMLWSGAILVPCFVLVTYVFFRI